MTDLLDCVHIGSYAKARCGKSRIGDLVQRNYHEFANFTGGNTTNDCPGVYIGTTYVSMFNILVNVPLWILLRNQGD